MEFSIDEPQYFDYYKQFLVEELVAYPNTLKAHYGKCCVYGKLIFYADTQEFILEPVLLINSRYVKIKNHSSIIIQIQIHYYIDQLLMMNMVIFIIL